MANHFGFDKGSLGLDIRLFHDSKMKQKSGNNYTTLLHFRARFKTDRPKVKISRSSKSVPLQKRRKKSHIINILLTSFARSVP